MKCSMVQDGMWHGMQHVCGMGCKMGCKGVMLHTWSMDVCRRTCRSRLIQQIPPTYHADYRSWFDRHILLLQACNMVLKTGYSTRVSLSILMPTTMLLAAGFMACLPVLQTMVANITKPELQGLTQGVVQSTSSLLRSIGTAPIECPIECSIECSVAQVPLRRAVSTP